MRTNVLLACPAFFYSPERFSRILLEKVGLENLKTWASVNRGAIVLCWWVYDLHKLTDLKITKYTPFYAL